MSLILITFITLTNIKHISHEIRDYTNEDMVELNVERRRRVTWKNLPHVILRWSRCYVSSLI